MSAAGDAVEANDLVVVLEAMKMETNVTAQGAGKVKNVRVAAGDSVKVGQVIVSLKRSPNWFYQGKRFFLRMKNRFSVCLDVQVD